MPALALDIGTQQIKALVGKPGSSMKVESSLLTPNQISAAVPSDEAAIDRYRQLVDNLFSEHKLPKSDVRLALPESVVSSKIIEMPPLSDAELASAIEWQVEQHIPIPLEELSYEYAVLFRPDKKTGSKMRVLLTGTRTVLIERLMDIYLDIGVEPSIIDTQSLSLVRSLGFSQEDPTTLVVNFGAQSLDMSIIHEGELRFVYSHMNGGDVLTRAIEQELGLERSQAEQYKRTYGLDRSQFDGKLVMAMEPSLKMLTGEMQKAIQFFTTQQLNVPVPRILLAGGGSQLSGLVQYVTEQLSVEVLTAAPFATAEGNIPDGSHPAYAVAAGLLMRTEI